MARPGCRQFNMKVPQLTRSLTPALVLASLGLAPAAYGTLRREQVASDGSLGAGAGAAVAVIRVEIPLRAH